MNSSKLNSTSPAQEPPLPPPAQISQSLIKLGSLWCQWGDPYESPITVQVIELSQTPYGVFVLYQPFPTPISYPLAQAEKRFLDLYFPLNEAYELCTPKPSESFFSKIFSQWVPHFYSAARKLCVRVISELKRLWS